MLSRKLFKILSPGHAFLIRKNVTHPRCQKSSCACVFADYSAIVDKSVPIVANCSSRCQQLRYYASKPDEPKKIKNEANRLNVQPINEEDVLEKFVALLSSDIHTKHRIYKNDLLKVLAKVNECKFCTKKQSLLLLECCTNLLPDESPASKMALAEQVWNTIKPLVKIDVEHFNKLLRVYIDNKQIVVAAKFIERMAPVKPDTNTYELLLKSIAEAGDVNQATEVIANMKSLNLPATESIFNSLIVCQGKSGNLQNIEEILTMMKSLKIAYSADTYVAIAKAMACNKESKGIVEKLAEATRDGITFKESQIMEIVKAVAEVDMIDVLPAVLKYLPAETLRSPSISRYMQAVATQLVFQNHPMAALALYNALPLPTFGPKDDQGLHGRSLVRDCVKASIPSSIISLITQDLMASGRNPIALQNAAEAALQMGKAPLALDMFQRMKQMGLPLRCHYFWPLLLQAIKIYGERGTMNTLQSMVQMEVTPDYDTMLHYVLPYMNFSSPQNLMKKLLESGLTTSTALTPVMNTLLDKGQVRDANEIYGLFKGKIDAEKLIKSLVKGYQMGCDVKYTANILEDIYNVRASDMSKDWVGRFLCLLMSRKKASNANEILFILRELNRRNIKISSSAAEQCLSSIPEAPEAKVDEIRQLLGKLGDEAITDDPDILSVPAMVHPKKMNEESLRAHLNELEAKGMNTRGVLRKLLQLYCREGNVDAAREILDKCLKKGVLLSAGMKVAIFDLYVKTSELEAAEMALADLNKTAPNFLVDEFKIIDLATLMVFKGRIDKAFDLINEQSKGRKILGGRSLLVNCWRLLDGVATHNSHVETRNMFELLTSLGYCQPENIVLGPLVRAYLKDNKLEEALKEFHRLANKYNKTPLKHEILCTVLEGMSDGVSEDNFLTNQRCNGKLNRLAQGILQVDKRIHGASDVQLTLIAALADVGYVKSLRKMFLNPNIRLHPDALLRHCERFADAKKEHALWNIAECAKDLRHIDVAEIYDLILDIYQRNDDVQKAFDLWHKMQEQNMVPSQKFLRNLCALAKANNKEIPTEIIGLLSKQTASSDPPMQYSLRTKTTN